MASSQNIKKTYKKYSQSKNKWFDQYPIMDLTLGQINKAYLADNGKLAIVVSGFNQINDVTSSTNAGQNTIRADNYRIYSGGVEANNLPGGKKIFYYKPDTLKTIMQDVYTNLIQIEDRLLHMQGGAHRHNKITSSRTRKKKK